MFVLACLLDTMPENFSRSLVRDRLAATRSGNVDAPRRGGNTPGNNKGYCQQHHSGISALHLLLSNACISCVPAI